MFKPLNHFVGLLIISVCSLFASGCEQQTVQQDDPAIQLLVYCGTTMVKPMSTLAKQFEALRGVEITIIQDGSDALYQSLKTSRRGDLYLPGSYIYRSRHINEGLLGEMIDIGFNQAGILVAKGNPKNITSDLDDLLRPDVAFGIANSQLASIGRETKKILLQAGIYEQLLDLAIYQSSDSKTLNEALKNGDADAIINWKATAYFDTNRDLIDVIPLPENIAKPKRLVINMLTFSQHKALASDFMLYVASAHGLAVFKRYGFLPPQHKFGRG